MSDKMVFGRKLQDINEDLKMNRNDIVSILSGIMTALIANAVPPYLSGQQRLEHILATSYPKDNYTAQDEAESYLRPRYWDALPQFATFMSEEGWTTNQVIAGLIFAATNYSTQANWGNERCRRIADTAMGKLGIINDPAVTNFFHRLIDEGCSPLASGAIPVVFRYSNLEPEIFDYLRTQCVRTNLYEGVAYNVIYELREAVETLPAELKPAATNRVAKFTYFSILHTDSEMLSQDWQLSRFVPTYSNSVQRLAAMRYIVSTSTNQHQRAAAQTEINRLTALPTNQLDNLSWITDGE